MFKGVMSIAHRDTHLQGEHQDIFPCNHIFLIRNWNPQKRHLWNTPLKHVEILYPCTNRDSYGIVSFPPWIEGEKEILEFSEAGGYANF